MAVVGIVLPIFSVFQYRNNQEKLNKMLYEAEKSYGSINDKKEELDKMTASGEIDVDDISEQNDEDRKKIDDVLKSPMAPFGLCIQAAALKCMDEQKYERAIWFWKTFDALGNESEELELKLASCYFHWGDELAEDNKYKEAAIKYEEATALRKSHKAAWRAWGDVLVGQAGILRDIEGKNEETISKYEEAFEKYTEAIKLKNDYQKAWKNWETALEEYLGLSSLSDDKKKKAEEQKAMCKEKLQK